MPVLTAHYLGTDGAPCLSPLPGQGCGVSFADPESMGGGFGRNLHVQKPGRPCGPQPVALQLCARTRRKEQQAPLHPAGPVASRRLLIPQVWFCLLEGLDLGFGARGEVEVVIVETSLSWGPKTVSSTFHRIPTVFQIVANPQVARKESRTCLTEERKPECGFMSQTLRSHIHV